MDFERICMIFSMQEPFYGILLSSMERVPDKTMPTLGVGRFGNVFKLYYNPDFLEKFNTDTVLELLKHECLHLALNHFVSLEDKENGDPQRHKHINAALDLEANCYIDRSHVEKEAGGVFVEDFGFQRSLGSREYFTLLGNMAQQQQQKQQAKNPQQPCNGGQGGQSGPSGQGGQSQQQQSQGQGQNQGQDQSQQQDSQGGAPQQSQSADNQDDSSTGGQTQTQSQSQSTDESAGVDELMKSKAESFDDHTRWPQCDTQQEMDSLQQVIDDMLDFAAEEVEKRCGDIPGELVGKISKIRQKKPRPVADWRRYFRRYLGNEFSEIIRKSKKRQSRRFPDAAGNRHRRKSHILVAIDTSGSVSMPEYREFFGQIQTLKEKATFHVVECDTRIAHEYEFNGKPNEVLHGGGGTSFEPPIELFLKNRKKYDALVYFTDGGAEIPANTPRETLWVISSNGDHDKARYRVNGATSVFIKK